MLCHAAPQWTMTVAGKQSNIQPEAALLTPPKSTDGAYGTDNLRGTIISISTIFFPGVEHTPTTPDLIFVSSDNVFFYVHSYRILPVTNNGFDSKWPPARNEGHEPSLIALPEGSPVLNLLFHVVYDLECSQYAPTDEEITEAVNCLQKYGISLQVYGSRNMPLYDLMLSRAPLSPINMYALAAHYNLEDLAIAISSHLLALNLSELKDESVELMGAIYLRRLIFLHLGRKEALKRLLSPLPPYHGPTHECGFEEQRKLMRAWSLSAAALVWDARPDLPPTAIESTLGSLVDLLDCQVCKQGLGATVKNIIAAWVNIKTTI